MRCLCASIEIGEIGARLGLQRLHVDLGLDEHETTVFPVQLLLAEQFLPACFHVFRTGSEEVQIRPELKKDDQEEVHDDRQEHRLARGDGPADDLLVLIATVEVEMNQASMSLEL